MATTEEGVDHRLANTGNGTGKDDGLGIGAETEKEIRRDEDRARDVGRQGTGVVIIVPRDVIARKRDIVMDLHRLLHLIFMMM
jgi:hypothetical protein